MIYKLNLVEQMKRKLYQSTTFDRLNKAYRVKLRKQKIERLFKTKNPSK